MAFTTAKMGLKIWNLLTDLYDHTQIADNWAKVDYHDHSPGKGVQIPTEGIADAAITSAKLASTIDPTGAFSTYRIVREGSYAGPIAASASTILLGLLSNPTNGGSSSAVGAFYLNPDDWTNPGRTTYLRVDFDCFTNSVAPTATYSVGLYPVTFGGSSGSQPTATIGTVVSGAIATIAAPALSTATHASSADFPVPSAGYYALAMVQTGAGAANSAVTFAARLMTRAV